MTTRKIIPLLLAAALTLALAGCAGSAPKDTPVRISTKGSIHFSLIRDYSFEEAAEAATLIADVTITEWLGENPDFYKVTFFSAKVNRIYKGEETDEIKIMQAGASASTAANFPLFKNGDRMILFLGYEVWDDNYEEAGLITKEKWHKEFSDKYSIINISTTILDVWEYDGETYILNRENYTKMKDSLIGYKDVERAGTETAKAIAKEYIEYDPLFEQVENSHSHAFKYDDVAKKLFQVVEEIEKRDVVEEEVN